MTHRLIRTIDRVFMVLAALGLLLMMLHISADILSDLLFNDPLALTSAYVTQYYMIAVAFLPLAAAEYREGHIGVDLLVKKLPDGPKRGLHLGVLLLTLGVYLLLTAQAWEQAGKKLAINAFIMEQTSRVVVWPSFYILPLSFAAISVLIAVKFACCVVGKPEPVAGADMPLAQGAEGKDHV